ncbi:MAG: hypothetical protein V4506_17200 [Bacteroidota bacterium]
MNASLELLKIKIELTMNANHLINEDEIPELLGQEFPLINERLERTASISNIYQSIQCFADFTKQLIRNGNMKEVKHCFKIADKMLLEGNSTVKNAIENCYVYSMATILDATTPLSKMIKEILPASLFKEYRHQVNASGI